MVKYNWKELEVLSITTLMNIITFIQFAIIPLNQADTKTEQTSGTSFLEGWDLGSITKVFLAILDFVNAFFAIATPMRTLLFVTICIVLFHLVMLMLFFPTWRTILFMFDMFLPGMFLFGVLGIYYDYKEQRTLNILLLIVGLIYILIRAFIFSLKYILRKNIDWQTKTSRQLTNIFLGRLTGDRETEFLDRQKEKIISTIDDCETAYNYYKRPSWIYRIGDFGLAVVMEVMICVLNNGVGWEKIITAYYNGVQLQAIVIICEVFCYLFIVAFGFRIICSFVYMLGILTNIFIKLRRIGFKLVITLCGVILLSVLNMILQSTNTAPVTCQYFQFYDFKSKPESFLKYFMKRDAGCANCSKPVVLQNPDVCKVCFYNGTLSYNVLSEAPQVSDIELSKTYMIPIALLETYFLVFFLQLIRNLFIASLDIVEAIPTPTLFVQAKFLTAVQTLQSTGCYIFASYRHNQALYYFTFTQIKLFVLFFASLFPIFPSPEIQQSAAQIISWMFFIASLIISLSQLLSRPYISILHNIVNGISYLVGSLAALISALKVNDRTKDAIPSAVGKVFLILVFVVPVVTTLIVPFFAKLDPNDKPTKYSLPAIERRQRQLTKSLKPGLLDDDEFNEFDKIDDDDDDRPHDLVIPDFSLAMFAPIHVKQGIDKKNKSIKKGRFEHIYCKVTLREEDFDQASEEMLFVTDRILDTMSVAYLDNIMTLSVIICSSCLGWGLGAGIAIWKTGDYMKCN